MAEINLLDGKTIVSNKELALCILKTALLSLEKAGNIEFEIADDKKELYLKPLSHKCTFPSNTLEDRLYPLVSTKLSNHIEDWLQFSSIEPATRTLEIVKLMFVLRGLAFARNYRDFSSYLFSKKAIELTQNDKEGFKEVKSILEECTLHRPVLWELLDAEILLAFKNKTHKDNNQGKYIEPSPWQSESQTNQSQYLGTGKLIKSMNGKVINVIFIGILFYFWYTLIIGNNSRVLSHLVEAGIFLGFFSLIALGVFFKVKLFVYIVDGVKETVNTFKFNLNKEILESLKVWDNFKGVFLAGFLSHLIYLNSSGSRFWQIIVLVGILIAIMRFMRLKIKKAINEKVIGRPITPVIKDDIANSASKKPTEINELENKVVAVTNDSNQENIKLNIIYQDNLVEASKESQKAINNVLQKRPAYSQMLKRLLQFLITGTFLMGIIVWFINGNQFSNKADGVFDFKNIYTFCTLYLLSLVLTLKGVISWISSLKFIQNLKIKWSNITSQNRVSDIKNKKIAKEVNSPRPVLFIVMFWIWQMISLNLITSQYLVLTSTSIKILLTVLNIAIIILAFWCFYKGRRELEKIYTYQPPLNMLALRVFGSPYLTDFLKLTNLWQYMGTIQRLDGPETNGERTSDIYNYLFNKIEDSIVENEMELKAELKKMKTLPDKNLRFSLNSMQCNDASWKLALHALIEEADLVVMDFSNLSEKNKGVKFELHKLFEEFPIKRTVMLINDSCDFKVLEEITTQAWNQRTEKSPNFGLDVSELVFYHTGVMPHQRENESIYEWKKRFQIPIDSEKLVGVLLDKAIPKRRPIVIQSLKENARIKKWTKLPISKWISIPIKIFIAIYFISSIYQIVTNLF